MSSSTRVDSSDSKPKSPPPSLLIEPFSIESISRTEHYFESKTKQVTFHHRWIIDNFSCYCLNEIGSSQLPVLLSSTFSPPTNESLQFRLELHPNGWNKETEKNVSLFLKCKGDRKEIDLKCWLWIMDSEGRDSSSYQFKLNFCEKAKWGIASFCTHEDILEHFSKLTPGDVLTIFCEISYQVLVGQDSYDKKEIVLTQLKQDCVEHLKHKELSDVVLVFGDGEEKKEFRAHKAILGARSEVFAAMFDHDMREKKDNRVEMTDVEVQVGKVLLKYLYGEIPNEDACVDKLLPIADKYQLHSLKSICEGELSFRINPESVGALLLLADMHNAQLLKSKCIEYIHCSAICVSECESVQDLMHTRPDLYYELFEHIPDVWKPSTWCPPTLTVDPFSWSYTGSKVVKCLERWTIDKFNENYLSVDEAEHGFIESIAFPPSKSVESGTFLERAHPALLMVHKLYIQPISGPWSSVPTSVPVKFSVKLFPHGENDDTKGHLSLYLQLKCEMMIKVAVKAKVSILVKNNSVKAYTLEFERKMSTGKSIGWPKFIAHKQLMDNKKLLLNGTGDRLVILCEVLHIANIENSVALLGQNSISDEHKFIFANDLFNLYESQKLTDAFFVLGHKEFKVHKSIVCARSEVFARMFVHSNRVQIDDVDDVEAFEQMIALVYGQTDGLAQWADKMLPLLDKFQLDSLKQVCQLTLCDQLDLENVAHLVMLADKHNAPILKEKTFEYILSNHSALIKSDTLKIVLQQNPKLFYEVLFYKLENLNINK